MLPFLKKIINARQGPKYAPEQQYWYGQTAASYLRLDTEVKSIPTLLKRIIDCRKRLGQG